jgi:hypothetical protein
MLLHLPIVLAATLSPVAHSDPIPAFDIARECRFEGASVQDFDHCAKDEADALRQVRIEWTKFTAEDKKSCEVATRVGGFASYVELLACLENAKEARDEENKARDPLSNADLKSTGKDVLK